MSHTIFVFSPRSIFFQDPCSSNFFENKFIKVEKPYLSAASDNELAQMLGHHNGAFEILYNRYRQRLCYFVNSYINDPNASEEIVQLFFIELYMKREKLLVKTSFSAYLYVSLRNRTLNYCRNQSNYKRHISKVQHENHYVYNDAETRLDILELETKIGRLINELPVKQQEVIRLKRQDRHTVRQIAGILKRPLNTVEKQLRKALQYIHRGMELREEIFRDR